MNSAVVKSLPDRHKTSNSTEESNVIIGKDVLELITGAMYVDPMTIFREYIQNSADSIDEARKAKLFQGKYNPRIDVSLDPVNRTITIRDNGLGISTSEFWKKMTAVGSSGKRGLAQRGFRGVGRLSGLGYASELIFRSRASGQQNICQLGWSGRRLREVLRDANYSGGLDDVIREISSYSTTADPNCDDHFFEVELKGVARIGNDALLNPDEVRRYLAQVAPVPFSPALRCADQIGDLMRSRAVASEVAIFLRDGEAPIERPLVNRIQTHGSNTDSLRQLELVEIPSLDGAGIDAVGWVAHHSYLGAIPRTAGYGGLRLRAGNIQIGTANLLDALFTEPRFNSWCIGEIHVLSSRIVPNGRRDDFELNAHYQNLLSHLAGIASKISKLCRDHSIQRNRIARSGQLRQAAEEQLLILKDPKAPNIIKEHYRKMVVQTVGELRRAAGDKNYPVEHLKAIVKMADSLEENMQRVRSNRASDPAVSFMPTKNRKVFLETLNMVIAACDSPEQAAQLTRRVFDRARRRYKNQH